MARNAFESDFRSYKMAAGSHFVSLKKSKSCVLIWNGEKCDQKWFSVIQKGRCSHFVKKKVAYWSEIARNAIKSDFGSSNMAAGSHFVNKLKKIKSWVLMWNGEKCDRKWFSVIQYGPNRTSKMAADGHFEKKFKKKLCIDLKWREMHSKVIFGHTKWPPAAILWI